MYSLKDWAAEQVEASLRHPFLASPHWPSHALTHLSAPRGRLTPLLSAVLKETWPLTPTSLELAPQLFCPWSPRWLVGSTKEDPTLQPAWSCLPLALGCWQQEECVPLASHLPILSTSEKCNH